MFLNSVIRGVHRFLLRVFVGNKCAIHKILFLLSFTILLALLYGAIHNHLTSEGDEEVDGWGINVNRNASYHVDASRDTSFSHVDPNICSQMKPLVIIIVCSDTRNSRKRNAIRETWAKDSHKYNILVMFLVGINPLEDINMETFKESFKHRDIIFEYVTDVYNNLTIKSILMLKWVSEKCMQARFLMKSDDDNYINLRNLYNYTLQITEDRLNDFLVGKLQPDLFLRRIHKSKWYIPRYMYPKDELPPYVLGAAYLMSTEVAKKLYVESLTLDIINIEDIYITGMCAQNLHITPKDENLFHYLNPNKLISIPFDLDKCQLIVVGNPVDIFRMHTFHHQKIHREFFRKFSGENYTHVAASNFSLK